MKQKLEQEILKRSKSKKIEEARDEWNVIGLYYKDEPHKCLCWQTNIKNLCLIRNKITWEECLIWNDCIEHFLNEDFSFLFNDIKKIARDITKAVSDTTLDYCIERWFIYSNNTSFYKTFSKCRNLKWLETQIEYRKQINREILRECYWKNILINKQ